MKPYITNSTCTSSYADYIHEPVDHPSTLYRTSDFHLHSMAYRMPYADQSAHAKPDSDKPTKTWFAVLRDSILAWHSALSV